MSRLRNAFALLVILLFAGGLKRTAIDVHAAGVWTPDARVPGYLDDTFTPVLVADHNRTVHAFASQWVNDGSHRRAVVYRQWSLSGGWTRPVDIILSPSGDAQILAAFLDSSDRMHVIFVMDAAGRPGVYYSSAPAANADESSAWSFPEVVGEGISGGAAAITGDDHGNLILIYSGEADGSGVYFATSTNAGASWSKASPMFLTNDPTLLPLTLRLATGANHQVRAAWNVVTDTGVDEALYFANYSIPDSAWSIPVELDQRINIVDYFGPSYPALVDTGSNILILYNGGNPYAGRFVGPGRPVMRTLSSSDGGSTWNGPLDPFPLLNGRSGEHTLVMDSSGTAHGLFVMRIDPPLGTTGRTIGGMWHSAFRDNNWSTPDRFVTTLQPHDVRAIVCQGNILLALWREDPGEGAHGVWFSYTVLDAPELPAIPLATAAAALPTPQPTAATPFPDTPTPLPAGNVLNGHRPSPWLTNPALPVIAGLIPVVLIVLGVLASYRFLNNPRK